MVSTGTYAFNPAISNLTLLAFGLIQIRRTEITAEHLADAELMGNFAQQQIATRQPNLWRQEIYSIPLTQGDAQYDLPVRMIAVRDAYLTTTNNGVDIDRVVWPLSPSEYDALPNKTQQAPPNSYLVIKSMQPTVTTWPVANADDTYTLNLRLLTQIQDATMKNGVTLDMPYRALEVFVTGLAYRLAKVWKPELEDKRKADFEAAWNDFANTDVEDGVSLYVSPAFGGYYR